MHESHLRIKVQSFRRRTIVLALLLCVLWTWSIYRYESFSLQQRAETLIEQEQKRSNALAQGVVADLQRSLRVMQGIPYVMANQARLLEALRSSPTKNLDSEPAHERKQRLRRQNLQEPWRSINLSLSEARNRLGFDLAYILDSQGDCLAASDHQLPDSLIGNNYGERHYFKAAINGESGYQFAFGKTSRTPGLYFSAPVFDGEKIVAVIVAKIDIARLAQDIDLTGVFLIDENGVVILAQDHHQEMKALEGGAVFSMNSEKRQSLYKREDFPVLKITPWRDGLFKALKQIGDAPTPFVLGRLQLSEKPLEIISALPVDGFALLESETKKTIGLATLAGCAVIVIVMFIVMYFLESGATQRLLQMQGKRLNEAQRMASMGSWTVDVRHQTLICSEAARWLLSIENSTQHVDLEVFFDAVHREDKAAVLLALQEAIAQRSRFHMGFRLVRANGEVHYVVSDGMPMLDTETGEYNFEGTIRDITEYQSLLNALESSEAHLKKVINSCLIGIVQGRADGRLFGANDAFIGLTSYEREKIEQGHLRWNDLTPTQFHQTDQDTLLGLNAEKASASYEKELICADGRVIAVLVGIALIDARERDWVAFVLDLSERNRVQRLQSEFIAIVSHELRTPLTSIRGSLALLENGLMGTLPEKALQMISVAHRNSKRLSSLVNDILDMEKLSAGKMKFEMRSLDLVQLLPQIIEANAAYAQACEVHFELRCTETEAYIWGDEERLQQVMSNLLSNAAKFSPPGETVLIALQSHGASWQIHVIDHGPGIPENFQKMMFDSFAQADNSDTRQKQGSGLGLKITKSMVELMEGEIAFVSSAQGTDFWISFGKIDPHQRA